MGTVKGSSGRDKLVIKANDKYNVNFYTATAVFENATIEVISQKRVWSDAKKLTMTNTSMTLSGYGQGFYIGGDSKIIDSYLYMKDPKGSWFNRNTTGMTFQGTGSTISGSTLRVDYGSNAGISVGLSDTNHILSITNSTLEFNNSGKGGLNVNTGVVELVGTTIKTNEQQSGALYGAQTNARLIFKNDTVVDSAAKKDADNGLGQTNDNYIVIGGSHHVKYAPNYRPYGAPAGAAIPTNGVDNGNEKLRLFTLKDSTVASLNPINKNNTTYLYSIAKPSADGKKYAWLPEVNVTFKLNALDAKFQDNTSNDKVLRTYRGGKLSEVEGNEIPANPTREGYTFSGWKLKDSTNNFNADAIIKEDLIYEAKWEKEKDPNLVQHNGILPGDILIGDDTGHDKLHEEKAGNEIEYTGKIGVASIKEHIQRLANNYGGDINTITLNDIESTFTTKITLEDGLDISNVTEAIFTDNNLFEIKEFSKSGNVVTVKYGLKKNYTKFTDLLTDVTNVPDVLEIKLPKVKVKDDLANGTKLKVVGTVEGTFKGFAKTASGNREQYDFKWTAEQVPSGIDIEQAAGDTTTIQYTILVKEKDPNLVQHNGILPGDILIGDDTGHDKLHEEKAGNEIEYTGKIGVASIKEHIQRLANNYGGDINTITLNDIESTFTTKITLEDGLDISNVTEAIFTDNNLFEIKEFSKSGNVVTVKYGLKKNYTKFTDLLTDVTNVPDVLEIKLPKVKVKDDLANGTKLKVVGTVEGTFKGFAKTASGNREQYDFKWTAEQVPSGIDIEQAAGDTTTIQYTVLVIKQVTPPLPEPTPGEKTVNSENGNEGATVRQLTEKGEVFRYDIKTKLEENSNHHNQFSISDTLDSVLQINKVAIKIDGAELDEDMVLPEYTQLKNKLQEATKKLEELAALEEKVNKLKSDVDKLETEYAAFPDKTVEEAKAVKIKLDNVKSELTIAKTKFEADKVNKPNLEKIVNDTKVEIEAFEKTDKFKLIRIINQALNSRNEKNEISADFVKKLGHLEIKGNTVEYLIDSPIILKQLDGRQITLSIYANILSGANLEKYIDKQHKVIKIANKAIITNNNVAKETNVVYVTLRVKDKPIIPNKPNKPNKPKKLPNTGKATADVAGLGLVGVTLAYLLARRKFNK